jgi:SAM-dependent methyltransferase
MYSADAEAYDRGWAPVLLPMGRRLLDELPLAEARRVLDAGTGTGVLHDALRATAPRATIVGADIAEGMLHEAQGKSQFPLTATELDRIAFRDGVFDIAVMAFVLHHARDPKAMLEEVGRVLRHGATLGVATWGEYEECPALEAWDEELDRAGAPDVGDVSIANHDLLDDPEKLGAVLTKAGFAPAEVWMERFSYQWAPAALETYVLGLGRRRRRFESLSPSQRPRLLSRARAAIAAMSDEERAYRVDVVFAVARS